MWGLSKPKVQVQLTQYSHLPETKTINMTTSKYLTRKHHDMRKLNSFLEWSDERNQIEMITARRLFTTLLLYMDCFVSDEDNWLGARRMSTCLGTSESGDKVYEKQAVICTVLHAKQIIFVLPGEPFRRLNRVLWWTIPSGYLVHSQNGDFFRPLGKKASKRLKRKRFGLIIRS